MDNFIIVMCLYVIFAITFANSFVVVAKMAVKERVNPTNIVLACVGWVGLYFLMRV